MLDLSKAFDTISHPIMHCKLACYEVLADELEWLEANGVRGGGTVNLQ